MMFTYNVDQTASSQRRCLPKTLDSRFRGNDDAGSTLCNSFVYSSLMPSTLVARVRLR